MKQLEITLPPNVNTDLIEQIIQEVITERGLNITLHDTLKAYPGSTHWHLKKGRQAGILEITLWPQKRRAWFSVQRGRTAPWIEEEMEQLGNALQRRYLRRSR